MSWENTKISFYHQKNYMEWLFHHMLVWMCQSFITLVIANIHDPHLRQSVYIASQVNWQARPSLYPQHTSQPMASVLQEACGSWFSNQFAASILIIQLLGCRIGSPDPDIWWSGQHLGSLTRPWQHNGQITHSNLIIHIHTFIYKASWARVFSFPNSFS